MAAKKSSEESNSPFPGIQLEDAKKFLENCAELNMKVMKEGMGLWKDGKFEPDSYKKFLDSWQSALSGFSEDFLRSQPFCEKLTKDMDAGLAFRKQLDQILLSSLKNLKIPSRDDLHELFLRIENLEDKLDKIFELLETMESPRRGKAR